MSEQKTTAYNAYKTTMKGSEYYFNEMKTSFSECRTFMPSDTSIVLSFTSVVLGQLCAQINKYHHNNIIMSDNKFDPVVSIKYAAKKTKDDIMHPTPIGALTVGFKTIGIMISNEMLYNAVTNPKHFVSEIKSTAKNTCYGTVKLVQSVESALFGTAHKVMETVGLGQEYEVFEEIAPLGNPTDTVDDLVG